MLDNTLEAGSSFVHRLDPKIRITAAFFLSMGAALCDNLTVATGHLVLATAVVILAGLSISQVAGRLRPLFWFLAMIWICLPLTFEDPWLFSYGIFSISRAGVLLSAKITIKSISILMVFSALIATLPMASLGAGLHQLKVPDKLIFLLLMTYRYIAVIQDEYTRLIRAARFRGFVPGTNLHSYKTFAYLAGMLFVRASLRAKRVYQAMLCRGFKEKFHTLEVYPPNGLNLPFLFTVILAAACLAGIELFWIN